MFVRYMSVEILDLGVIGNAFVYKNILAYFQLYLNEQCLYFPSDSLWCLHLLCLMTDRFILVVCLSITARDPKEPFLD